MYTFPFHWQVRVDELSQYTPVHLVNMRSETGTVQAAFTVDGARSVGEALIEIANRLQNPVQPIDIHGTE